MNVRKLTVMILMGIFTLFNVYGAAFAQSGSREQHGPPPEAYSACEGKSEGDTASFESPHGDTITGTCAQEKNGDRLVLRPDNPPDRDKSDNKK